MPKSDMKNLYERVVEVLGKSHDDQVFVQLIKDLGEMPEIIAGASGSSEYLFDDLGLALQFMDRSNCFVAVFFHWASAAVRTEHVKPYAGNLAAGIEFGDSHEQVAVKLRTEPVRSRATTGELHEEYELNPLELHCKFNSAEELEHLSVWFTPACFWRSAPD